MPWLEIQLNTCQKNSAAPSLALSPEESGTAEVNTDVKTS